MLLHEVHNIVKIYYEAEDGLFIHEWLEYNPEYQDKKVLQALQKIYDLLLEYPATKVMVRADQTKGAFSPTIQNYIRDTQFPRLAADTHLKYVATIVPQDMLEKASTVLWEKRLDKFAGIELANFGNEKEARDWLASV